jgi:predicted Zn-dependent protease with MMP-like domain
LADEELTDATFDEAEQALSEGEYERVEELLGEWADGAEPDPDACAFVGLARFYAGDTDGARPLLEEAIALDAGGAEAQMALGGCEFLALEITEAEKRLRAVVREEPEWGAGHYWLARLLDWDARGGQARAAEAREHFARAFELDPEGFPAPLRLTEDEFDAVLKEAIATLPPRIGQALEEVNIVVDAYPSAALLEGSGEPLGPDLLGLYQGTALPDRSLADTGRLPDVIHLFQRSLEVACADREELVTEIRDTLLHEVGHFLGMDEEELEELDL